VRKEACSDQTAVSGWRAAAAHAQPLGGLHGDMKAMFRVQVVFASSASLVV
jgi:hypothetical protein